jgi:hypothetical protein
MKTRCVPMALVVGAVLVGGCASYPFGLTQSQWTSLTPRQQAEYRRRAATEERDSRLMSRQIAETIREAESLPKLKSRQDGIYWTGK